MTYPTTLATDTTLPNQIDGSSIVDAADVNLVYAEIIGIEQELGINPSQRKVAFNSGTYSDNYASDFVTVDARIENVETAAHQAYTSLNVSGGVAYLDGGTHAAF